MNGLERGHHSWSESLRAVFDRKVIVMLFLGFSAGVPILLVFSTLSIWLSEAGISRANIGVFSLVALGYGFKFVWAPIVDKLPLPVLGPMMGHRRSWLLLSQLLIALAIILISSTDPKNSLYFAAAFAVMLSFSSATQDIIIDAYRIESADSEMQGMMSATYIAGYRIGMVAAGVGALEIAAAMGTGKGEAYSFAAWSTTYQAMAGVMLVGIITTFVISEPVKISREDKNLRSTSDYLRFLVCFIVAISGFIGAYLLTSDWSVSVKITLTEDWGMVGRLAGFIIEACRLFVAVAGAGLAGWAYVSAGLVPKEIVTVTYLGPFVDFFKRYGKVAILLLALIATYRIADVVMGVMANVFYVDMGFEKQDIGRITKGFGLIMTIIGGFVGGILSMRFGVMKTLFLGALLAAGTNVLFALLAQIGNDINFLKLVIAADNLSGGIASAAFVAYLSGLTNTAFTASQYAIFSSMMVLLPKVLAGYSGFIVEDVGYEWFFIGTAALGLPVLILIVLAARLTPKP